MLKKKGLPQSAAKIVSSNFILLTLGWIAQSKTHCFVSQIHFGNLSFHDHCLKVEGSSAEGSKLEQKIYIQIFIWPPSWSQMLATTCLNQVLFVCPLLFSCGFSVLHSAAMSVLFILLFSPAPLPFSYLPDAQKML